jgi:hypothetical protein
VSPQDPGGALSPLAARRPARQVQVPLSHVPEQHSEPLVQSNPVTPHVAVPHTPFAHCASPQQSDVAVQVCPMIAQPTAPHCPTPLTHWLEQHWLAAVHGVPVAAHAFTPH